MVQFTFVCYPATMLDACWENGANNGIRPFHCIFFPYLFRLEEIIWRPDSDEKYTQRLCPKIYLNRQQNSGGIQLICRVEESGIMTKIWKLMPNLQFAT